MAGDIEAGNAFLERLSPFIWRKHLDFAAIRDIHSIKRQINALTAQTSEGTLFEVDMRLRPSGNAGPLATNLDAFVTYHQENAWTWEHQALTRALTVPGPGDLRRKVDNALRDILTRPRDGAKLIADVAGMRARMDAEHHTWSPWRVKHLRGGLVDIEFIAQ